MKFQTTPIEGVCVVTPDVYHDERGFFFEAFNVQTLFGTSWVQDNQSYSKYGVLRGLHFQEDPFAQAKLVRCLKGEIEDVVVDLRKDSPTYLEHFSIVLSDQNLKMLFVPRGFAHGFLVLSSEAEVLYKIDNSYSKSHEAGLRYDDPILGISWSIQPIQVCERDRTWPLVET